MELLRRRDAARLLGVSARQVDKLRHTRQLGFTKVGSVIFVPRNEIEKYLMKNFVPAIDFKSRAAHDEQ